MKSLRHASLVIAVLAALPLAAAEPTVQPEIVVTASRRAETVDQTLATVSVISRADIEQSQAPDLLELLRLQVGIDIARTGGSGQSTSLFLRGTNSNHTLVLIDGVRVSSTLSGAFDFAHLPVAEIERIEIVRGPRAAFWGSEAIGGVIQIFTRRPQPWSARVGAGSHDTYRADSSAAWQNAAGMIGFSVGRSQSHGISAQNTDGFSFDPDRDGYRNNHLGLQAETTLGTQALTLNLLRTSARVDFDQGQSSVNDTTVGLALSGDLGRHWSHRLAIGSARDELETAVFFSRFKSRRETVDWQQQWTIDAQSALDFGLNYVSEHGRDIDTFSARDNVAATRHNTGIYGGYRHALGSHDLQLALRQDHNSEFGGASSLQAAWGWQLADPLRLTASYGEGFRAPNLNEQFSPGFGGLFIGNPALDPERSHSAELGLRWQFRAQQSLEAHAYRTRIHDLISFSGGQNFQAENIARARIDGYELEHSWRSGALATRTSLSLTHAENAQSGNDLLRRPRRKLTQTLDYAGAGGWSVGAETFVSSGRDDFAARLPGYGLINLRGAMALNDRWRLEARLDNLFDRRYELASGFNSTDRSLFVAIVASGKP